MHVDTPRGAGSPDPALLKIPEVAQRLRVGKTMVYEIASGRFSCQF